MAAATPEDAGQARDEAEESSQAVLYAAVASVADDPGVGVVRDSDVWLAALRLALLLYLLRDRQYAADAPLPTTPEAEREEAEGLADEVAREAVDWARQHRGTVEARLRKEDPAVTQDAVREALLEDTEWVEAASRTMTTKLSGNAAYDMLKDVEAATGEKHRLLWISRGDRRVRSTHRRLHGEVRPYGMPFWRGPDGELRFPGDPFAPLRQTINCRCVLFLVPAAQAKDYVGSLRALEPTFDLTASAGAVRSRAEEDLLVELKNIYPAE